MPPTKRSSLVLKRGPQNGWKQKWMKGAYKCTRCGTIIGQGERAWFHLRTRHVLHLFCGPGLADGSAPRYTPTETVQEVEPVGVVRQYKVKRKK